MDFSQFLANFNGVLQKIIKIPFDLKVILATIERKMVKKTYRLVSKRQ